MQGSLAGGETRDAGSPRRDSARGLQVRMVHPRVDVRALDGVATDLRFVNPGGYLIRP